MSVSVFVTADALYRSVLSQKAPRSPSDWPVGGYQCRSSGRQSVRSAVDKFQSPPLDGNKRLGTRAASRQYLVNGCSQTGQSGEAVHVNLAAVRLSSHQVGSGSRRGAGGLREYTFHCLWF